MQMPRRSDDGYLPIADYGVIGNLRTAALVGRDGSLDWCCLPELDSPSVFAALLDARRGGRFRVAPSGLRASTQRYQPETNILETEMEGEGGRLLVTDFMPLRGSIVGAADPLTSSEVHRLVRCLEGDVMAEVEWAPRFDYARVVPHLRRVDGGAVAEADGRTLRFAASHGEPRLEDDRVALQVRLRRGEEASLVAAWGDDGGPYGLGPTRRALAETADVWRAWSLNPGLNREWAGPWEALVVRSKLALKLLTHPASGAIAAAATTSLPERIGGVRNWDYRFSWIRDAAFTVQAPGSLGHWAEAVDFFGWAQHAARTEGKKDWGLRLMYGLNPGSQVEERTLDHLEGYRRSRPVRIGNGAAQQQQHDIYGELLDAACEFSRRGRKHEDSTWPFLAHVADRACEVWREPDAGIWEVRGGKQHFVYSKVMCWVAVTRAVEMAERNGLAGAVGRWRREAAAIRAAVLEQGYDRERGAFVQSFGSKDLDAANLLIALEEFLPCDDPRVVGTIDRTREELMRNGMVYRYLADDGLPGHEGAFGLCTFWLVDNLALGGRVAEARELMEEMARRASPLGLYSEQMDPGTGELLGNFPQAFSHIGFINSALYLARAEGRPVPFAPKAETKR